MKVGSQAARLQVIKDHATVLKPYKCESRVPCSAQRAVQPAGVTWTTMRRRHCGQYRGGSSVRAAVQGEWSPSWSGWPQRSQ
jgi:hypothetical protein